MPRQERIKSKSGYYHIMIRGNEKKNIFLNEQDKLKFVEILFDKKAERRFFLHAFCLMDNHVHLLLCEGEEDVSKVMKRITVSYVYYFNKKYRRVGHLFQDRYKSEAVEEDSYVLALSRYIHQNPVKAGIVKATGEYKWSSYNAYLDGKSPFSKAVDTNMILSLFSKDIALARKEFVKFMNQNTEEIFLDIMEKEEPMDEHEAKKLYQEMLKSRGVTNIADDHRKSIDELIKDFKQTTNLSIRKIAAITGLNKDKINKILKN
ncbi:transposase [Petroclostridium sp. X23]|uniref:transposase n=1 Tax=Petroclostridium sp. X23 TaxID=3045146 RepID=UPI0024AD87E7|nr:transposase [Petroclostridium sp. X23]WHH60722.1 transposase [Petroclostridium sp. X23]